jgi:AmmeMemoRadiSam system protein A/AmmeMemoRadiSam system protein B
VADRNYRVVILLAFNHRRRFERAALLQRPAMRTPLGDIPIDTEIAGALLRNEPALFAADETAFTDEHALETQLPFLQVALPDARIVPVLVGADNRNRLESIGAILFARFENRRDVLFAVSSDMSHFFTHETATRTDTATLTALINGRTDEWLDRAAAQQAGMCGVRPLYAFISMFENYPATARAISLLRYQTSADATGERNRVVGYAALAFSVSNEHRKKVSMEKDFGPFGLEERRALMNIARTAVKNATIGRTERPAPPELPALNEHGAAFVTLRMNGELRGCIGHVIARMPLFSCVDEVARSAAIHDTRFSPLTPAEFQRVSFEISILTTPEPIRAEHVEVGTHGLIMTRGGRSGLLLPQVPVEWGWDREGFLAATCRKAGLPTDCWKDPQTEIRAFRAIVFDETDI